MSDGLLAVLAFIPILSAGILLIGFRISAKVVMPIILLITIIISTFMWGVSGTRVFASSLQGPNHYNGNSVDYFWCYNVVKYIKIFRSNC